MGGILKAIFAQGSVSLQVLIKATIMAQLSKQILKKIKLSGHTAVNVILNVHYEAVSRSAHSPSTPKSTVRIFLMSRNTLMWVIPSLHENDVQL